VKYVIGERLTAAKITDLQPNANNSLIYVSGPEPMVESLGVEMKSAGLPNDQLEQDFFPNYSETNY
jgi:ferredoxin-NADP reductase